MTFTAASRVVAALMVGGLALSVPMMLLTTPTPAGASELARTPATPIVHRDVSDFSFESFSADYYLDTDSAGRATMRVVETLVARFPEFDQNRGIIRSIPLRYGEYDLNIAMTSVTDGAGTPVYYERSDYDGFAEFALGTDEFVRGRTVYVLEYTMTDPIRYFADSGVDEFYWDINGNGWPQQFDTVTARVFFSEKLAAALTGDASCYLGYYGESNPCELTRNDSGTEFEATVGPVGSYNTMTLAIGMAGGTIVQPQLPRDSWIVRIAPLVLLGLQGALGVIAIIIRTAVWRDARGRGTVIAQYTPPDSSDLILDANLVGRQSSGLPAQLVDFAVRGMARIIDTNPTGGGAGPYSIEFVTSDGASPRELRVLVTLFGASLEAGKRVNPATVSAAVGASLYGLPASAAASAISSGLRAEPQSAASKVVGRAAFWVAAAFVPIWIFAAVNDVLEATVVGPAIATVVLWIVVPIILVKPRLLTREGAEAKEYLLGLREYLTIAEEDRLRVLQSPEGALRIDVTDRDAVVKLNERLLPYAVLWGVEDRWVEELRAQYAGQTPNWLESDGLSTSLLRGFSTAATSSVRPLVTQSSSSSSWSSSGGSSFSSGSSGGGFSGGGGGGGGGGGR